MRLLFTALLLCLLFNFKTSAQAEILFRNAKKFDVERYEKFSGSAYLWKENKKVTIYPFTGDPFHDMIGNYNLAEGEFEIYDGDKFVVLRDKEYPKITYLNKEGKEKVLFSFAPKSNKSKYYIQHYQSTTLRVFEDKKRLESTVTVQTPGKTETIDKFKKSKDFFMVHNGKYYPLSLKKKKITKKFGHKKEINSFIKDNKLKVKKIEDMVTLLKYMDEQGWIK